MKVLVVSQYWVPEDGVPQRRWEWLTQLLRENGYEVVALAPRPHYRKESARKGWLNFLQNFKVQSELGKSGELIVRSGYIPSGESLLSRIVNQFSVATFMILAVPKLAKVYKVERPDIVIGTVPALPTAIIAQLIAKIFKVNYVIDLRDAWPELLDYSSIWDSGVAHRQSVLNFMKLPLLRLISRITKRALVQNLRRAEGVITTAESLRSDVIKIRQGVFRCSADDVVTVRNVFPAKVSLKKLNKHERKDGTLNVLYAGTVGRAQDLENALHAAKIAREQGIDLKLRIVGDGAALSRVIETAGRLRVPILVEKANTSKELEQAYYWADTALVHLANWPPLEKAVPSKTYELMQLGLHISAVVSGESAKLVERTNAGHVIQPSNPEALADLWINLARNTFEIESTAKVWVEKERSKNAPQTFLPFIKRCTRK